ncbi:unnamed protein product [Rotaria sordida]|uniref:Uncharacterized protein n=1 Tax=Rotaria sordida TaxID=392033 RepID=A0A815VUD2_9BILA|nr:unnamed protein product [Rotaria sordida]CAF1509468.1 unnamed protein product [Rotaria sordida]CAF1537413.1 unnamed protein product [Rotaria sordida]CAF3902158.1 unnamed protein product [Rotaria sordida]CAF4166290.1 unnamed protein product [Rotaria sordida]
MARHCKKCHGITPNFHVNFCSHCGADFRTRTHRSSLPSASSSRTSSASAYARRSSHIPKTDDYPSFRTRSPSPSVSLSSYRSKFRPISTENESSKPSVKDRHKSSSSCQYKTICGEYLSSLKWQENFFNRHYNRCYCNICYSLSSKDTYVIGGSTYVVPRDWCRFGLHVDQVRVQTDRIWDDWIITYHGTSSIAAQSIVAHRQFLVPGDKCIDGSRIHIRPGHIKDKYEIYTSPTIAYSSLDCYCPSQKFHSTLTNKEYNARIVLQCRQKPGAFTVQRETVGAGHQRICPIIPNDQIEIFTTIRAAIVPYGVLIHLTEACPSDH